MRRLAVLSFHTSPLLQPGIGDSGGMNVYVREMATALARQGVRVDIFTRRTDGSQGDSVEVEPNLVVHHVSAGPASELPLAELEGHVGEFTSRVLTAMTDDHGMPLSEDAGGRYDAIHANYWLSAVAGHTLKHELGLPLAVTFHTLDRVKAEADPGDAAASLNSLRARIEATVIGCADAVLASCAVEADQLVALYDADPQRIVIVPPAIDHAFFAPGDPTMARDALHLARDTVELLFVGRLQPLKRPDIAVLTLAELVARGVNAHLSIIGGPSGPEGGATVDRLRAIVAEANLEDRVRFVPPQPHHLLSTWYRASDVVVVPSRSESFGLVALEAATCGIPVVASKVGGLTTLVTSGVTGELIETPDPLAYTDAISAIVRDDATWASFSRAATALAAPYTWSSAATELSLALEGLRQRASIAT